MLFLLQDNLERLFTFVLSFIILIQMATAKEEKSFLKSDFCSIFTSKLYKTIIEETDKNVISSPASIHLLLSFLFHGAKEETAVELMENLNTNDLDQLSSEYKKLTATLNSMEKVELQTANSLYLHDDIQLLPEFSALGLDSYNFAVSKINLEDNINAADQINKWVMEKTKNRINNIISSADMTTDTRMILVNAIYFKGSWKFPFNREDTTNEPFYLNEKTSKLVPTMKQKNRYAYFADPVFDVKFIQIPFINEDLSMTIILPNEILGLALLEQNFDWGFTANIPTHYREIILHLPKFKVESTLNLKSILSKIGIKSMFDNTANFSGMTKTPVKISKVIQKAFVEVNEEGCEAAAATSMKVRLKRMIEEPEVIQVNHPFKFAIYHKNSDVPLFMGTVRDIDVSASLLSDERDEL